MANRFWEKFNQGLETGTKIWNADSDRRMRAEIAAANAMKPEAQSLGVNAPAAGQVPVGYENYIQANEGGGFVPRQEEGLAPDQLAQRQTMAERFSAPNAFAGEKTQYTLGGLTQPTAFSPDDIARARMENKANIYSNYGKEDLAETMRTNALAREAAGLQIDEMKFTKKNREDFKRSNELYAGEALAGIQAITKSKNLLDIGDKIGALRALSEGRTSINDSNIMRVTADEKLEGSSDGGKTWKVAKDFDMNKPGAIEGLIDKFSKSIDERGMALFRNHITNPKDLMEYIKFQKDEAARRFDQSFKSDTLTETRRHNLKEEGLKGDELKNTKEFKTQYIGALTQKNQKAIGLTKNGELMIESSDGSITTKPLPPGVTKEDIFSKFSGDKQSVVPPAEAWKTAVDMIDTDPKSKNLSGPEKLEKVKTIFNSLIGSSGGMGGANPFGKNVLDNAFGATGGNIDPGGLAPSATFKPLPRNPYNIQDRTVQTELELIRDPLTGQQLTQEEYERKFGSAPNPNNGLQVIRDRIFR